LKTRETLEDKGDKGDKKDKEDKGEVLNKKNIFTLIGMLPSRGKSLKL
jgi:hypothetical protein